MKKILSIVIFSLIITPEIMAYEELNYQIIKKNEVYEIRKYSDRLVVETITSNQNSGFRKLFNYISGKNEDNQEININWDSWEWPAIFKLIQDHGNISDNDMIQPFNLGIGLILIIDENYLPNLDSHLKSIKEDYVIMGEVVQK